MKFRIFAMTATAVGALVSTGALAGDNNHSGLWVDGDGNSALIVQSGSGNLAGTDAYGINASSGLVLRQLGNDNELSITQAGNGNSISTRSDVFGSLGALQNGNGNKATITQNATANGGNVLGAYLQNNNNNVLRITQGSDGTAGLSYIMNGIAKLQQDGGAELTILQQAGTYAGPYGGPGYQRGNTVGTALQTGGTGDVASITQVGTYNYLAALKQEGAYNIAALTQSGRGNRLNEMSQNGSSNTATVSLTGNQNGADAASGEAQRAGDFRSDKGFGWGYADGAFGAGSNAATVVGVVQGKVTQHGNSSDLSYTVVGNANLFGFVQDGGNDNTISGTVLGDSSQVAVLQNGTGNVTNFTQWSNNDLGVSLTGGANGTGGVIANSGGAMSGSINQLGEYNKAKVTIVGSTNHYGANQTGNNNQLTLTIGSSSTGGGAGDGNFIGVTQAGNDTATIDVKGGNNRLGVQQVGTGTGAVSNQLVASIDGASNNTASSFTGDALTTGLTVGSVVQNNLGGNLNKVTLTVKTNANAFAVAQVGAGNTVNGTIDTGGSNQAAVYQVGNANSFSFQQSGGGNNVGVIQ